MKKRYKNKRDQYKAERDEFENQAIRLTRELEKVEKQNKNRLSCIAYCENCQIVSGVIVPHGQTVRSSGCANCGVRNVGHLVTKVLSNTF